MSTRVLAVDLGASSVRVATVDLDVEPDVHIVHRWRHGPVAHPDGSQRWDWERLRREVETGLAAACAAGPVASIGVDGWGVDYALVDDAGELIAPPFSYRDPRTAGWEEIVEVIGRDRLYEITGVQLMPINTVFQLAAHPRAELAAAKRLLMLPDLLVHAFTGAGSAERSNASTTGLLDGRRGDWAYELVDAVGLDRALFPEVIGAGREVGRWRGVSVTVVGSHDTASAFLGMPGGASPGTAFVSAGTWVIVGVEREAIDTSPAARAANFSNEVGAFGGYRFLKNIAGFWLLDRCRPGWGNPPLDRLFAEARDVTAPVFDAADSRFAHAGDIAAEVRDAAGLPESAPRGVVVRSILESIAAGVAAVVAEIGALTGEKVRRVAVVGGGSRARLLLDLIGFHTGLPVLAGSPEATALGNAAAQGVAIGHFRDVDGARQWVGSDGG